MLPTTNSSLTRPVANEFPRPKGRGIGGLGIEVGTPQGAGNLPTMIKS